MKGRQELEGKAAIGGRGDPLLPLAVPTLPALAMGTGEQIKSDFTSQEEAVT